MDYLDLFNAQLQLLKKADYSHLLLKKLEDQQIEVLAKASKIAPRGLIPFLPVLPRAAFRFSELMPRIVNHPNFGETTIIKPKQLIDSVSVPQEDPYYIFGVDDGVIGTRGKTPKRAGDKIKEAGRRGFTILECLALFMHCGDLPQNHCLWALSSCLFVGSNTYYVALLVHRRELQRIYISPNLDSQVSDFGPYITPSCQP